MITAKTIRAMLETRPFRAFRVCMSDGSHHDIAHHDMAWVTQSTVEVGINPNHDGFAEYVARCSILHITRLEDLDKLR